jgi:hypothetical protein
MFDFSIHRWQRRGVGDELLQDRERRDSNGDPAQTGEEQNPLHIPGGGARVERERRELHSLFQAGLQGDAIPIVMPEGTVKSLLHRARQALGAMMEGGK